MFDFKRNALIVAATALMLCGLAMAAMTWVIDKRGIQITQLQTQLKAQQQAVAERDRAWDNAQTALRALHTTTLALETAHAQLSQAHRDLVAQRVPRLVRPPSAHGPAHGHCIATEPVQPPAAISQPLPAQPGAASPPTVDQTGGPGDPADGIELTLGAVWLWNSALSDQPSPVGACNPLERTAAAHAACAAPSGLSIDDVLANQAANAKSCAQDRAQLAVLIDLIRKHQAKAEGEGKGAKP